MKREERIALAEKVKEFLHEEIYGHDFYCKMVGHKTTNKIKITLYTRSENNEYYIIINENKLTLWVRWYHKRIMTGWQTKELLKSELEFFDKLDFELGVEHAFDNNQDIGDWV